MKYFISAIFAGMMISFGGIVYLSCLSSQFYGAVIGSFLFSLGLLTVVARGYDLYTGKIGYLSINFNAEEYAPTNLAKNLFYYPIIILGNFVGTAIIGYAFRATRSFPKDFIASKGDESFTRLDLIVNAKLNDTPLSIFLLACACGVMMYLAVDGYKKTKSWLFVILPVMVFILCGFEHCVANMFYFCASDCWSLHAVYYLLIMIAGNAVGAIAFNLKK
ncbi:MAG: formate/nitrite transporter family protein [Opitutales bacterium]|nr:formate/nitrite transporter family protein [Opitutales bacterium]